MLLGYARVSTKEQNLEMQVESILKAGIDDRNIFKEKAGGYTRQRPAFDEMMKWIKDGDSLYVYKLDRLSRDIVVLINVVRDFVKRNIKLISITEPFINTTNPNDPFFLMTAFFGQIELARLQERIANSKEICEASGRKFGGQPKLRPQDEPIIREMFKEGKTIVEIAKHFRISRTPIYNLLKKGFKIHV